MKRLAALLMLICLFSFVSCGQEQESLNMGLNAEIVDIDLDSCTLYVKDMDMEIPVFGEKCALDCRKAIEDKKIIYVNYEAENDMRNIEFGDLFIGDTIIISIYDSEKESAINGTAAAEQVQLATQRMN